MSTVLAGLLVFTGCAGRSQLYVLQPQLAGRERELRLLSEQVIWSDEAGGERLIAEFPLPGAATGDCMYLLYLRVLEQDAPGADARSRGFFLQTRGRNAGLAFLVKGYVGVKRRGDATEWSVDAECEDGSRLNGVLTARRDHHAVRRFERETHAADVREMLR